MSQSLRRFFVAAAFVAAAAPAVADGPFVYHALTPCRVADTRQGFGGALTHNTTRDFDVRGDCGVPPGAAAVSVNLTVVPSSQGHIRAFPAGTALPNVSAVNFVAGSNIANGAIVPLGTDPNDISIYLYLVNQASSAHVIIDVTGYFASP